MQTRQLIMERHPEVYDPSEDTMLFVDNLKVRDNDTVLEIGSGSGYISLIAAQEAKNVVGVDINPHAVKLAKLNAKINNLSNVDFVLGDIFAPISGKFSLILMNPPYLQNVTMTDRRYIDYSWDGGENGRRVTDRFTKDFQRYLEAGGGVLIVQSSLSECKKTIKDLCNKGFKVTVKAKKRLFFETLYLLEAHEGLARIP